MVIHTVYTVKILVRSSTVLNTHIQYTTGEDYNDYIASEVGY